MPINRVYRIPIIWMVNTATIDACIMFFIEKPFFKIDAEKNTAGIYANIYPKL